VRKLPGGVPGSVERPLNDGGARPVASVVAGRVEQVLDGTVRGWAWKPAAPHERVSVRVTLDNEEAGGGVASLARRSLAEAGMGDGRYGFSLPLPAAPPPPDATSWRVEADGVALPAANSFATAGRRRHLDRRGVRARCRAACRRKAKRRRRVESVRDGLVTGWASSPPAPGWRVGVRAILDGRDVAGRTSPGGLGAHSPTWASATAGADSRSSFLTPVGVLTGCASRPRAASPLPPAASFTTTTEHRDDPWYVIDVAQARRP